MGSYFSRYNKFTKKIKDKKIRKLFKKFTYEESKTWDYRVYNLLNKMIEPNYDINSIESGHLRIFIIQEPACWLLLIRNESFLNYIELTWSSMVENIYNCEKDKENDDIVTSEFKEVFYLINNIHGDRFKIFN